MNKIQLKSIFWRDQIFELMNSDASRMRIALMIFYWMDITNKVLIK